MENAFLIGLWEKKIDCKLWLQKRERKQFSRHICTSNLHSLSYEFQNKMDSNSRASSSSYLLFSFWRIAAARL